MRAGGSTAGAAAGTLLLKQSGAPSQKTAAMSFTIHSVSERLACPALHLRIWDEHSMYYTAGGCIYVSHAELLPGVFIAIRKGA